MAFAKGTLVYVDFTAKVKDNGDPIETTREEDAKKLDIYDADRTYEPRLVAVGEDWVLKGLDEEIAKMDIGEKKTAELPPDRAWGGRDPTLLRMMPLRKFGDKADELRVGDEVEIDNRVAVVRFIGSGRAQVDFNHKLAGKTLVYDIEALRKVEPGEDTIRALMKRRFPGEGEKLEFKQSDGEIAITIPDEAFLVEGLQFIKRGIANDILHFVPETKKVVFTEVYPRREEGGAKPKTGPSQDEEGTKETPTEAAPAVAAEKPEEEQAEKPEEEQAEKPEEEQAEKPEEEQAQQPA